MSCEFELSPLTSYALILDWFGKLPGEPICLCELEEQTRRKGEVGSFGSRGFRGLEGVPGRRAIGKTRGTILYFYLICYLHLLFCGEEKGCTTSDRRK